MFSPKVSLWLLLSSFVAIGAHATDLAVNSFSFYNGAEWPGATGGLQIIGATNGDAIQALHYDFSAGGNYVQSVLNLPAPVTASYVRFRVNAPTLASLSLRVRDQSGQVLQFNFNRGLASVDDLGWSELSQSIGSSPYHYGGTNDGKLHGGVTQLSLVVNTSAGAVSGTAYFRAVELLTNAPAAAYPVLPQHMPTVQSFQFGNGPEFNNGKGALGSLQVINPPSGAAIEALSYNFSGGGHYVASVAQVSPAVAGSYVHFRFWAPAQDAVTLQVLDQSGQTLSFAIDRSVLTTDNMGWSTVTQYVATAAAAEHWGGANNGVLQSGIAQIRLIANRPSTGSLSGVVYFNDLQILDHAPSQSYPTLSAAVTTFKSIAFDNGSPDFPGATGSLQQTALGGGDVEQTVNYNFTGGGHYVDSIMQLTTPAYGNTLRFLAQTPAGVNLMVRVIDSTNQSLMYVVNKPLATLNDAGWVQYAVRLGTVSTGSYWGGADDGVVHTPVKTIMLLVDATPTNTISSYNVLSLRPTGTVRLRRFLIDQESDLLDLIPKTNALAGERPVGSDAMDVMAVSLSNSESSDFSLVQAMGFRRIRFNLNWSDVERSPGVFDFSGYDNYIQEAHNYGLDSQVILTGNNMLYAASTTSWITTTANLNAYTNFAAAAAAHFKEGGIVFELWNEADIRGSTPTQFAALVKQASARMHAANSSAQIISGGLVQEDFPFVNALVSDAALGTTVGVGVHPYSMAVPGLAAFDTPENAADSGIAAKEILQAGGKNQPLWSSEQGASASWYGDKDGQNSANLLRQAIAIVRSVLSQWAMNAAQICVYELRDATSGYSATNPQYNFGLIGYDYNDKPAKTALQLLLDSANGRTYQGLVTGSPSSLQAMKFAATGKETVYVVWTNNKDLSNAAITTVKSCNAALDFAGKPSSGVPCISDIMGNALSCASGANGRVSCPVSEAKGPIFIRQTAD